MRIVVNDIAAQIGGAMTILKQFYAYLCEYDRENEWIFLLSENYIEETENIRVIVNRSVKKSGFHKLWFDFVGGRRMINRLKPDAVLSLQNILTFGVKAPQYVYIHQSLPFQREKNFSFRKADERVSAVYQHLIGRIIKLSAKKADGIIVQTQWMKNAVLRDIKDADKKCLVALPDIPRYEDEIPLDVKYDRFFYPTNGEIYKNDRLIEQACEILRKDGVSGFTVNVTLPVEQNARAENIRHVGRLTALQMQQAYAHFVLLFPSYIETVGLPLLEAMQTGTMILAANCEYAHEILDGYENARFFDPWNAEELAALMKACISGELTANETDAAPLNITSSWKDVADFVRDDRQNAALPIG